MSSLFEDLCTGLQEAIDFEKGIGSAKKTTYIISPIKGKNASNKFITYIIF